MILGGRRSCRAETRAERAGVARYAVNPLAKVKAAFSERRRVRVLARPLALSGSGLPWSLHQRRFTAYGGTRREPPALAPARSTPPRLSDRPTSTGKPVAPGVLLEGEVPLGGRFSVGRARLPPSRERDCQDSCGTGFLPGWTHGQSSLDIVGCHGLARAFLKTPGTSRLGKRRPENTVASGQGPIVEAATIRRVTSPARPSALSGSGLPWSLHQRRFTAYCGTRRAASTRTSPLDAATPQRTADEHGQVLGTQRRGSPPGETGCRHLNKVS